MAYIAEINLDTPLSNGGVLFKVNPMRFSDWQEQKAGEKRENVVIAYINKRADAFNQAGQKLDLLKSPVKISDFDASPFDFNDFDEAYSHNAQVQELDVLDGDGVFDPIVYELKHVITLEIKENEELTTTTVDSFIFSGVTFGNLMKIKNAKSTLEEFKMLMTEIAKPNMSNPLPVTDFIINQISFEDYNRIMGSVGKKLLSPSKRLKKL